MIQTNPKDTVLGPADGQPESDQSSEIKVNPADKPLGPAPSPSGIQTNPADRTVNQPGSDSLPLWSHLAQGEIEMQEKGHKLVQTAPGQYEMQQVAPSRQLSLAEKVAIQDAFRKQYGFLPDQTTPIAEAGAEGQRSAAQIQAATMAGNTLGQNLSGGIGRGVAGIVAGPIQAVAPGYGNQLQQTVGETYAANPNAVATSIGQIAGGALPMLAGGGGVALMGAGAFGQVRGEVQQRRAAGEDISVRQELQAAAENALVTMGLSKITQGGAKLVDQFLLPGLAKQLSSYVVQNGIAASDMMVMQAAQNAIRSHYYAPEEAGRESAGVSEAGVAGGAIGALSGALAARANRPGLGPEPRTEAAPTPAPSPDLTGVLQQPEAVKQTLAEEAKPETTPEAKPEAPPAPEALPANLSSYSPKTRIQDENGGSHGVPLDFDSPVDKALYVASQPRKGKLSTDAAKWLEARGISPEEQQSRAADVRDHVEAHSALWNGEERLSVPALETKQAEAPAPPPEETKATPPSTEPAFYPAKERRVAPVEAEPEVSEHQDVLDRDNPGARVAPLPKQFSDVVDAAGKVGKTDVVGYSGGKGRGFFSEGRLFLNVDNPANFTPEGKREVAMHEAAHGAQQTAPDVLESLAKAAPQSIRDAVYREYAPMYAQQEGRAPSAQYLDREVVPMVVGKLMRSQRAFNEVFQENRGLLARGIDALLTHLRGLTEKGRYTNQITASLKELKARTDMGTVEDRAEAASYLPEPTQRVRDEAEEYTRTNGLPYNPDTTYAGVDEARAKRIADWYESAEHAPNDPAVAKAYAAFKKETLDQWNYLASKGMKFEPWQQEGQPYKNSGEVIADVRDNKHLAFFTGGELPADHPLAEKTGIRVNGQELTYNDVFRAVHDYFGHAKEGVGFGPRGEENAWRSHSQMYSDLARSAMSTETRGQNSWVNFGPYGEQNRANPKETHYAEQKAAVMPAEWTRVEREQGPAFLPDYKPKSKENQDALDTIKKHLTPEEWEGLSTEEAKKAVGMLKSLPPDSEFEAAAKAGVAMKGWYERSADTLRKTFGPDAEKFTDLLAALSPRQSVINNLREATRVWAAWNEAGRPTEPERLQRFLNTEVRTGKFNIFGHPETEKLVNLRGRIPNAVRALSGQPLSGPKVTGFAENLQGNYGHTTNDTWMATFGGVDQKDFDSPGGYLGYTAKLRSIAAKMGWTPANVQETVWSTMKTLAESVKGGRTGAEAFRGMTHEQVAATPAFDNLMGDADVTRELQRAGLQPPQATTAAGLRGPVVSELTPEHEAIAARAEQWAASKGRTVGGGESPEQLRLGSEEDQPLPVKPNDEIPFLPGGQTAKKFWEEDLAPTARKVSDAIGSAWEGVKSIWAPQTRAHAGLMASETWRQRNAELAQRWDRLGAAFDESKKFLDKLPVADTRDMIDRIERGQPQARPELQKMADAFRSVLDDRLHQVQNLGTGKLADFIENYFPHLWENPKKAANLYAEVAAKTPLEGRKGFLKARTLPFFSDGIARGLTPVTENPAEMMMLRAREMDKYITAHQAFQEMAEKGLLQQIKASDPLPPGYSKINDNMATLYAAPSRRGAVQIAGYYVAPDAVANVINNQLSPGLRGNKYFGGAFRGFLGAGNLLNSVQLGLSGFHLAMTTMDSAVSKMALGFRNVGQGQFGEAAKNVGKSLTVFGPAIENIAKGNKMMKEWFHPGSTDPETANLVNLMKQAGGRAKMDDFYHTGVVEKMAEAFRKGNYLGAALRAPAAAMQLAGKPLMETIVPRMKMGAFMDMAKFELERLGPNAPDFEVRRAMGRAWDSVDNRMGQLVYDNLFWNKTAKDLAMASTRSVGWNLGTLRELGGGALDFGKAGLNLVRGRNAEFTHRMAYTAAMPVLAGLVGGMIHYLNTGQRPDELKDYYFPKTGTKDESGHDVRLALPSYMKDVYAYAKNPAETVKNKVHPLVHTVFDMLSNSDYYGNKIRNEDDPVMKQLLDVAKYGGKQFLPFSTREVPKLMAEGQGVKSLLPLIGVTPARKDITYSPAELKASELIRARIPPGQRTQEQANRSQAVRELASGIRAQKPGAIDAVSQAVNEGRITPSDIESLKQHVKYTGLAGSVRSLDMHDAMQVWDKASPEERRTLGPTMFQKLRATRAVTREQKVGYLQTLQRDWAALKAGTVPAAEEDND